MEESQYLSTSETLHRITPLISCGLLIEYFNNHGVSLELDTAGRPEKLADVIDSAIRRTPKRKQEEIAAELEELDDNADAAFVQKLIAAGRISVPPIAFDLVFPAMSSDHERSMWARVHHAPVYVDCLRFEQTAKLRYHPCKAPDVEVPPGDQEKAALAAALSKMSVRKSLGKGIEITEHKNGNCRLFVCFLEHAKRRDRNFDARSVLGYITRRPAYEIVFRYDPVELTLKTYVKGGPALRREAELIFGETMLGIELPNQLEEGRYDISRFLRPGGCMLDTTGVSEVERVAVTQVHARCIDSALEDVDIHLHKEATNADVDSKIQRIVSSGSLGLNYEVAKVRLSATFRASQGRRRSSVQVDITEQWCSLKEEPRHKILGELLKVWKIDVIAITAEGAKDIGKNAQRVLQLQ